MRAQTRTSAGKDMPMLSRLQWWRKKVSLTNWYLLLSPKHFIAALIVPLSTRTQVWSEPQSTSDTAPTPQHKSWDDDNKPSPVIYRPSSVMCSRCRRCLCSLHDVRVQLNASLWYEPQLCAPFKSIKFDDWKNDLAAQTHHIAAGPWDLAINVRLRSCAAID